MHKRPTAIAQRHPADDALARLLAAESRLAERLAAAREAADEALRLAREDAQRIEASCVEAIAAQGGALEKEYRSRSAQEVEELGKSAQLAAARFEAVDGTRLREYVALVIERLLPADHSERSP
ncbi:MAG: hypothetical protein AB1762_00590 [Gemmatimonadota bacterium]